MIKWRRVRNKAQWVCDICRTCGDESCCEDSPAEWIKRLELTTNRERDALHDARWGADAGPRQGSAVIDWDDQLCLCNACWDAWQPRTEKALQEALQIAQDDA